MIFKEILRIPHKLIIWNLNRFDHVLCIYEYKYFIIIEIYEY